MPRLRSGRQDKRIWLGSFVASSAIRVTDVVASLQVVRGRATEEKRTCALKPESVGCTGDYVLIECAGVAYCSSVQTCPVTPMRVAVAKYACSSSSEKIW